MLRKIKDALEKIFSRGKTVVSQIQHGFNYVYL